MPVCSYGYNYGAVPLKQCTDNTEIPKQHTEDNCPWCVRNERVLDVCRARTKSDKKYTKDHKHRLFHHLHSLYGLT